MIQVCGARHTDSCQLICMCSTQIVTYLSILEERNVRHRVLHSYPMIFNNQKAQQKS